MSSSTTTVSHKNSLIKSERIVLTKSKLLNGTLVNQLFTS